MKPAEIDLRSLAPRVRNALAEVSALAPNEHTLRSIELMAALAQLQADDDVLLAALLVPLRQGGLIDDPRATTLFGEAALRLAAELERVGDSGIPAEWNPGQHLRPEQAEGLRKLLLALASDVRLVLIRLALQLVRMRGMKAAPEHELRRAALETQEIYAPLANRLGIWQFKWELEDLAFRFSAPGRLQAHRRLAQVEARRTRAVHRRRQAGTRPRTRQARHPRRNHRPPETHLQHLAQDAAQVAAVRPGDGRAGRARAWSTRSRNATRRSASCTACGSYIPGEFDDYIATPKGNNYRSLHTAVIGPGKLPLEVQIRTREMHEHAELGVAAHWQYKEGRKVEASFQQKMVWLRQLLEPTQRDGAEPDLLAGLQAEVFEDRVFALSPKGEVVDLPRGATPLDFAYQVHTNLGHRCRGARVNGRMVTLDYKLSNGDTVEIIPSKQPHPSRDWLLPQLGFLASPRSRAKVRGWFRKQDEVQNREQGRQMLERELDRLGVRAPPLPEILSDLGLDNADALYQGLGEGDITLAQVAGAVHRRLHEHQEVQRGPRLSKPTAHGGSTGMVIDGVGDLLSTIARCCRPVPPEAILGYITIGRGVSVHRASCGNLLRLQEVNPERVIPVDWGRASEERTFAVAISIDAYDRRGLVRDISGVLADEHISIEAMNTVTDAAEGTAAVDVTVKVHGLEELSRLLARFSALPNVIRTRRRH